jgi:geranylgeranyl pyrophosphate synthase
VKASEAASDAPNALCELLESSFLAGDDHDSALARGVSRAIWDDALLTLVRDFLARPSKAFRARLVELGYRLASGKADEPPPALPLIIECIHAGSLIIDDIEDGSDQRREAPTLHRSYGVPRALNAGNWLYFWPQVLLSRLPLSETARLRAFERVALCLMHCHEGQALDLSVRVHELKAADVPTVVAAITRLKTGALLGLSTALGAIAAEASTARVDAIAAMGRELGVGLQMLDDLSGVLHVARRHKAIEDLRHGRATWLWALLAEELDRHAYESLQLEARDVMAGAPAEALIERVRFRVGTLGTRRARAHVQKALAELEQQIGASVFCEQVLEQFARLERRYAQG